MKPPVLSPHFQARRPSAIRQAQILFAERPDRARVHVVNVAIGNVSLPMHPAMRARMATLDAPGSPFRGGVVRYTETVGTEAAQAAALHVLGAGGFPTAGLRSVITDGGSQSMELALLGVLGPVGERPLVVFEPVYSNYIDMAKRIGARTIAVRRELDEAGRFNPPPLDGLEAVVREHRPAAVLIIPADNPTGHFMPQPEIDAVARLCVEHGMWLVSDEAYRQLQYTGGPSSSVWGSAVPGVEGRRVSIESVSKVWNACGLRVGGIITDNAELHARTVAEYTANLCANAIGQHIFAALADEPAEAIHRWWDEQRRYYATMMRAVADGLLAALPGLIVSRPLASLYSVVDVRRLVGERFDALEFVTWCAQRGSLRLDAQEHTLLVAPMRGFYAAGGGNPGRTQMRIAYVAPPEEMAKVPALFAGLLRAYLAEAAAAD